MSFLATLLLPALIQTNSIPTELAQIEAACKGKLGAAIITSQASYYSRKNEYFSLQSVMKLMVSMVALEQVDKGKWKLNQKFVITKQELSISYQPLAEELGSKKSITVTLDKLVNYAVTKSCSASADFMIRKLGGTSKVNEYLKKRGIQGMTIDRQERQLQTEVVGLTWNLKYSDEDTFQADKAKQPAAVLDAAYAKYQKDKRDSTTPYAMGLLLKKLLAGQLLSPSSTKYLLSVMENTETGTDRLKAGVPNGWKLAHKTGTSSTHKGVACATNDVGIARNAKGDWIIIVALLRNSTLPPEKRDNVLCQIAKTAFSRK
ncbi:MAG: class A beta-lactamase [Fimbriimonadaceae bacterium]